MEEENKTNSEKERPIIIVINNDGQGNYGGKQPYRQRPYRRGGGSWGWKLYWFFKIIKWLIILGIILGIFTLVMNPKIFDNLIKALLVKTGLWNIVVMLRRLLGR